MRKQQGFSLIELLIVLLIIAILAAIAIPAYRHYAYRAHRADAMAVLNRDQQLLERCNAQYFAYNSSKCPAIDKTSEHGDYTVALSNLSATTYTLTATAVAGGAQAGDSDCHTFSVDSAGVRAAASSSGADTSSECWR